jgi:hypothetical protein
MANDNEPQDAAGAIAMLADALGVRDICNLPGCWEHQVDEQWWIAVNGRRSPSKPSRGPTPIEPFHVYVEFKGWPAALFRIGGDGTFAAGTAANEDTFVAACVAAARKAKP